MIVYGPAFMITSFRAERAVLPSDGANVWVVVDASYGIHVEACAFLAGLRGLDRSVNTERAYAGRVALFLSWYSAEGLDWRQPRLDHLVRFKCWLVTEPIPSRGTSGAGASRYRSAGTGDAILSAVCEFLRFCARHDLVDPGLVRRLHEPHHLRFLNALRADRETAMALDADDFVTRNLADQADAFSHVATTMRDRLANLPDDERAEVEHASTVLRKLRAGRPLTLLPLTVKQST